MASWLSSASPVEVRVASHEPKLPSWSKKKLFLKTKPSDEWHQQIDFTAGQFRPSDHRFPWTLVRKHTNHYLKKKGKLNQTEIDVKLAVLIERHQARDVAVAACAHTMSPAAVRALLNVELNVAPSTFSGLEKYLESLIAANVCSPKSVTDLEARWAHRLLPYAKQGPGAAGRYLEGICVVLRTTDTPNMNVLPDFAILARRAFRDFATQLEGMKQRCHWVAAHAAVAWMAALVQSTPAVTPPNHLTPEHLLDAHFPLWRIYTAWKPNLARISLLSGIDSRKRGVLPDMLALEGPDFINGTHATLRDGLIAQYGTAKPLVRFRGLVIEVPDCTKSGLAATLNRTVAALETALKGGNGPFNLFVQLAVARPITQDGLSVIEAASRIPDTPKFHVHNAILEVYLAQNSLGGRHITSLQHLICALDDARGEDLRKVLLRPWLVQGIEKCYRECLAAVRTHIDTRLAWTHLAVELHTFCAILKGSTNCLTLLDEKLQKQLDNLPPVDLLKTVIEIYTAAKGEKDVEADTGANALKSSIEAWCIDRLMERGTIGHASQKTVDALVQLWSQTKESKPRRILALTTTRYAGLDFVLRCRCLQHISSLPAQTVLDLYDIFVEFKEHPELGCISLTSYLASVDSKAMDSIDCWKDILYKMIESLKPKALLYFSLGRFTGWEWSQFMLNLNALFADVIMNPKAAPPFILHSHLHLWVQQLSSYLPAITRLEEATGDYTEAVRVFLKGGEGLWVERLVKILECLTQASEQPVESLMQKIVGKLAKDGENAIEIGECVTMLLGLTPEGLAACERIYDAKHGVVNIPGLEVEVIINPTKPSKKKASAAPLPIEQEKISNAVLEVMVAGWLQDAGTLEADKAAIKALATLLALETYEFKIPEEKLEEASEYFAAQEAKLIEEAERLKGIQDALKARDPKGTAILLAQLGIEETTPLDEEIESLPVAIAGAVEKHGDTEVEISFPLASYTELQKTAMGTGKAKTLLVRLFVDHLGSVPPSFCLHLDIDALDHNSTHTPWICLSESKSPEQVYCAQTATPYTWQLSRLLHRHLKTSGPGIADLHEFVKKRMEELAHLCIVCGQTHNVRAVHLRRSTPCPSAACSKIWNNVPLDIRIPELRSDPFAADMLLTTVYAAAMSTRTELLPGCPIGVPATVKAILNALPSLSALRDAPDLSAALHAAHNDAEKLLVWALTHFRGFVSTAQGICKIHNLPAGTHQFVLANASPKLEADFAAKLPRGSATKVLFHGTSLDRLPSILAQGLRIHSGTALQRTGAAHGKGIYMAEDPVTSFSYSPSAVSWRNSGLNNMRLLLGCEVVGNGRSVSPGIHVIQDEKMVMLRYIFLLNNNAYAPNANHVVPAMGSAMSALRMGAV